MLQWATKRRPFFRCVLARSSVINETRLCVQSFVSPFASQASTHVKLSPSKVSRRKRNSNQGDACVSASKVHSHRAPGHFSAGVDAKIPVRSLACKHLSVDGDTKVFESATFKTRSSNGDARVTESVACRQIQSLDLWSPSICDSPSELVPNDDTTPASSSKCKDKCLSSDVSNSYGKSLSLQTFAQTKNGQKVPLDLQQKLELLESEQFSFSDAAMLFKRRAFRSCSFKQFSTVLQVLKEIFPSAKVAHEIVAGISNILLQPAEVVQQKLKLLIDFQVEEKVASRLCSRSSMLLMSVESLQTKLLFYKDTGLTVEERNMMFFKGPLMLTFSIENAIQPTLDYLESTGLTRESIWKLGGSYPELFYMSLDNNLTKRYEYFSHLGFSATDFAKAFRYVARLSIKRIEERRQSLKDRGFTDDEVRSMAKRQPAILACSPVLLKCKVDFLICEQNRDMAEIVNNPCCLTYSLQGRIIPRMNCIKELGDSKVYMLSSILNPSDSLFMKRFRK